MNNQAAQTMPALVDEALTYFAKAGDDGDRRYVEAIRKHIAALSQTAGVESLERWERTSMEILATALRKRGDDLSTDSASWLEKWLSAAPAASGGESLRDWSLRMAGKEEGRTITAGSAIGIPDVPAPQPPAGASVSERALVRIDQTTCNCHPETCCCGPYTLTLDGEFITSGHETYVKRIASALEQALTQQRGECEAVDRDAWAEALELPQGYTVEEFLPGGWHYAWTRADGERMVSGTTWNHPALAAIAAWQYAPATTPQPGAEALRELVQQWRTNGHPYVSDCADELESLLARGA